MKGAMTLNKSDHICMLVTKLGFQFEIKMWDSVYKRCELSLFINLKEGVEVQLS